MKGPKGKPSSTLFVLSDSTASVSWCTKAAASKTPEVIILPTEKNVSFWDLATYKGAIADEKPTTNMHKATPTLPPIDGGAS